MVSQAYVSLKSAVLPVEKLAGGVTPTVLLGYKSMSTEGSDDNSSDGEQHECPADGCSYTSDSEHGAKIHYGRSHEGTIGGVEYECAYCGATNRKPKSAVDRSERLFCPDKESDCRAKWLAETQTGEDAPNWRGGWVEVECAWCGETKETEAYRLDRSERFFCGDDGSCRAAWRAKNWAGENGPNWRGGEVEVECVHCGGTKEVKAAIAELSDYHLHGGCKGPYYAEQYGGEDTPNWRGGFDYNYGHTWERQRAKALERDGHECVVCGKGENELGREPDVHHIIRKDDFDDLEAAHELDNLVTLCRTHHCRWEGIPLRPQ